MPALLGTRRVPYLGGAWTPLSLPGLVLWLDAAVIGQGDNTSVALWRDRSGQGNHATQGTVAHQPTYLAAGMKGHPAVQFDGVDDNLAVGDAASLRWGAGGFAVVVAYSITTLKDVANENALISKGFANWEYAQYNGVTASFTQWAYLGGSAAANQLVGLAQLVASAPYIGALTRDGGGGAALYLNGAADGALAQAANVSGSGTGVAIGARPGGVSPFLSGRVAHVLAYSRALAAGERHQVETWLGARYGIGTVQS